jgi:hypothetical protein
VKNASGWLLLLPGLLLANERRFGYSVQTPVLPAGQAEWETSNTLALGPYPAIYGIQQREELEVGVGGSTQASLYLDLESSTSRVPGGGASTASQLDGFSVELKHSLTDPTADALGSALYLELGVRPDELELEGKILLDKTVGPWAAVANAIVEGSWGLQAPDGKGASLEFGELPWELDGGLSYRLAPWASVGAEVRFHEAVEKEDGQWESRAALFAGPVATLSSERLWATLTVLPQLTSEDQSHPSMEVRLLTGLHI